MADAFDATFWWALVLLLVAVPAALLLPRRKPDPVEDPDDPEGVGVEPPMLIGH